MQRADLKAIGASLALATIIVAAPGRADDLESLLGQNVVSTASKSLETGSSAPATSTVITAEDIRRYGIHSIDEAINFLSMGMFVQTPGTDASIGARGVAFPADYGDHVLLLVNGHAINDQWAGAAYFERGTAIPMEIIDHIEVILGPGSVLYGSEAMLGVINIVTKSAKDWDGLHAVVESELPTSIRALAGIGQTFHLLGRPSEITFAAEYYAQNGPDFRLGPQAVPGVRFTVGGPSDGHWGGLESHANFSQIPSGYLRAIIGDFEVNVRGAIFRRGIPNNAYTFDDGTADEVDRWLSGDIKHRWVLAPSVDLLSRLYADSYDYGDHQTIADPSSCVSGMPHGCLYSLVGFARWVGLEEELSFDWLKDGRFVTLVGVDGRIRRIGSKTDYVELVTGRTPGSFGDLLTTEKALGAYAQQTVRVVKELVANGGVRLDVDDRFGAHVSPRVALGVSPWEGGTLKGIYSEAFRAPTAYERYYADPGSQVAAPDLHPETARSFELTFEERVRSERALFGVFRTLYSDLVELSPLSTTEVKEAIAQGKLAPTITRASQYRNVAGIDGYGFNAAYEGTAGSPRLRYGATLTGAIAQQHATSEVAGAPLVLAPQASGNARVSYDLGGLRGIEALPTIAFASRFLGSRPADFAYQGYGYVPEPIAPVLVELRGTLSGKVPKVPGLSYRASLDWVSTNRAPFVIGPGTLAAGQAELAPIDRLRASIGLSYDVTLKKKP